VAGETVSLQLINYGEDILKQLLGLLENSPEELSATDRDRLECARTAVFDLFDLARTALLKASATSSSAGTLPEIQAPAPDSRELMPADAVENAVEPPRARGRILLAAIDPEIRAYVHQLLVSQFDVDMVQNGAAALAHIHEHRPDLLLLGVRLQRVDGFELLRAISEDPGLADLPVILLSANISENARLAGLQSGATGYLVKPFSAVELAARAARAIEARHAAREALAAERRMTERLSALASASLAFQRVEPLPQLLDLITYTAASLISAHQSLSFVVSAPDWERSLRATWLSDKYAAYRSFSAQPAGNGIYAMVCESNRPVRLTQAELEAHPRFHGFGEYAGKHPPMRGWLAAPLTTAEGRNIGLMQLSDKLEGDFTEDDEAVLVQLAQIAASAIETSDLLNRLHQTASELSAAAVTKDQMLGLVSHELRTPLTTLRGNASALRRHGAQIASEERESALVDIEHDPERLAGIVDNMLTLARMDSGFEAELEPLLLRRIMESAISDFGRYTGHAVQLKVPVDLAPVLGKEQYIHQVLINLLTNAVKYGGNTGPIEVELTCAGDTATVSVADRGRGMSEETISHLWEPFFRAQEFQDKKPGIGLGLPVCKRLMEAQHGKIWAEQRPGGGSIFFFSLPIVREG
jgi:signal transduction histidine kinase/CheY-like chemotaxis protein